MKTGSEVIGQIQEDMDRHVLWTQGKGHVKEGTDPDSQTSSTFLYGETNTLVQVPKGALGVFVYEISSPCHRVPWGPNKYSSGEGLPEDY